MTSRQRFTVTCGESGSPDHTIKKTETGPPSYAVINTIDEISDTGMAEIEPLYSSIDPDALDQLFRPHRDELQGEVEISFSYNGYDVTITQTDDQETIESNSTSSHE